MYEDEDNDCIMLINGKKDEEWSIPVPTPACNGSRAGKLWASCCCQCWRWWYGETINRTRPPELRIELASGIQVSKYDMYHLRHQSAFLFLMSFIPPPSSSPSAWTTSPTPQHLKSSPHRPHRRPHRPLQCPRLPTLEALR